MSTHHAVSLLCLPENLKTRVLATERAGVSHVLSGLEDLVISFYFPGIFALAFLQRALQECHRSNLASAAIPRERCPSSKRVPTLSIQDWRPKVWTIPGTRPVEGAIASLLGSTQRCYSTTSVYGHQQLADDCTDEVCPRYP